MTQLEGRTYLGGWVAALAFGLSACGGTVDLRGDDGAAGGGRHLGGAGGEISVGGGVAGSGESMGGSSTGGHPLAGGSGGSGGSSESPTHVRPGPVVAASEPVEVDDGVALGGVALGTLLAYDANPDGLGSAIYLTSLEATVCAHRLTDPAVQAKHPVFSADGTRLAYSARISGVHQIHVLDLASGVTQQVTDLPYGATKPSFSAEGTRLAFITGDVDRSSHRATEGEFDVVVLDFEQQMQRVVLASTDGGCCSPSSRAPTFFGDDEIVLNEHTSLIAINLNDFARRDVMPSSGRIPIPSDPSMAPDGIRYAYSDYCGGAAGMYIGRVDGSTGDTCANATRILYNEQLVGADWGPFGKIAGHLMTDGYGLVMVDDESLEASPFGALRGARNPSWGPEDLKLPLTCISP